MGKGVELTGKNKEKIYPITASDLVYDKDTKKNIKTSLSEKVEEAPKDGKQYARINGAWGEVEAGAVSETALITLTPVVDELKGVSVTVTTSEGETIINTTWQGATLIAQIRAGLQYTVAVGSKDGFIAPEPVTYTAEKGLSRSINMSYIESKLRVNILSNQSDDATIAAVKATVTYGSTTVQVANGGEINLPLNASVSIIFPEVEGYKAPDAITYIHTGGSYEKSGTYQTEIVSVNLSANNGQSVSGQIVTINGTQHTWNGSVITQKVPFGAKYTVSANSKEGYAAPATQSFTANQASRSCSLVYYFRYGTKEPTAGIYIQTTDGYYLTKDDWNKSQGVVANGVAYISSSVNFVIAKNYATSSGQITSQDGAVFGDSLTMFEYYGEDTNGRTNSQIIDDLDYSSDVDYALNYTFPNGQKGYLGAAGEWVHVFNNRNQIEELLVLIGGKKFFNSVNDSYFYWTSTRAPYDNYYDREEFWAYGFDSSGSFSWSFMKNPAGLNGRIHAFCPIE